MDDKDYRYIVVYDDGTMEVVVLDHYGFPDRADIEGDLTHVTSIVRVNF